MYTNAGLSLHPQKMKFTVVNCTLKKKKSLNGVEPENSCPCSSQKIKISIQI